VSIGRLRPDAKTGQEEGRAEDQVRLPRVRLGAELREGQGRPVEIVDPFFRRFRRRKIQQPGLNTIKLFFFVADDEAK